MKSERSIASIHRAYINTCIHMQTYIHTCNYIYSAYFITDLSMAAVRGILPLMQVFCVVKLCCPGEQ